jgi:lipopolysaccharide/colanic/teichoic acid biosynthesis glycosyltransferase
MVANAEKLGGPSTADDDPRITRIGRLIRKYKIDEVPQLINVLKGDMSFVGPRPEVQHYVNMFTEKEREILRVRPGITDWASLWNPDEGVILAGSPDPEKAYMERIRPTKIRLQLKYMEERSLWVDMKIILFTLKTIMFGRGKLQDELERATTP